MARAGLRVCYAGGGALFFCAPAPDWHQGDGLRICRAQPDFLWVVRGITHGAERLVRLVWLESSVDTRASFHRPG